MAMVQLLVLTNLQRAGVLQDTKEVGWTSQGSQSIKLGIGVSLISWTVRY